MFLREIDLIAITILLLWQFRGMKNTSLVALLIASISALGQKTEIRKYSFRSNPEIGESRYTVVSYLREDKEANTLIVDSFALEKMTGERLQMIKGFEMEPHRPSYIEHIDSDPHYKFADFNFDSLIDVRLVSSTGMGNQSHHYWVV